MVANTRDLHLSMFANLCRCLKLETSLLAYVLIELKDGIERVAGPPAGTAVLEDAGVARLDYSIGYKRSSGHDST